MTLPQSCKVVLVQPNDAAVYAGYKRSLTKRTPLGLAYIAGSLLAAGHDVSIVDASLDDLSQEAVVAAVFSAAPHVVGLTCTTPLFPQVANIVNALKQDRPDLLCVLGGPHVSSLPEASLARCRADVVCIGDGEASMVQLLKAIHEGRDPSIVPSLCYRSGATSERTDPYRVKLWHPKTMACPPDLDTLPLPARHILRVQEYVDYARGVLAPQSSVITSRGCVGRCGFCSAGETFVRFRSAENVLAELEELYHRYGIRNLVFYDDSFTTRKDRIIGICQEMVRRGIRFCYQVQLRLDQVDDEVMRWLVESGCDQVGPGIESGNPEILESICKSPRATPEFFLEKCAIIKKYPVRLRCSYIMGWIDETEEQVWDTIRLAREIDADENAFSIATPYPGTRMWEVARQRGLVDDDMDFTQLLYYHRVGCNLSKVPTDRLLELHELAYREVGNRTYRLNESGN